MQEQGAGMMTMISGTFPMANNASAAGADVSLLIRALDASEQQAADDFPGLLRLGDTGCANIITMVIEPMELAARIMVLHRGHCQPDEEWAFQRCITVLQNQNDIDDLSARELCRAHDLMWAILRDHQCTGRQVGGAISPCPDGCISLPTMPARRAEQLSNSILVSRRFRAQLRTQLVGHLA